MLFFIRWALGIFFEGFVVPTITIYYLYGGFGHAYESCLGFVMVFDETNDKNI